MTDWVFAYDTFEPDLERQREALLSLSNGYMGTRAAVTYATTDDTHYPGTYVAGVFDRARSEIEGRTIEIESIVNLPNWLPLSWRIDGGEWFDLREVTIHEYREALDLRKGLLTRSFLVEDGAGRRTRVAERRFVHMRHYHLAGLETTIHAENWSGRLDVRSGIDGRVRNGLIERERELTNNHLDPVTTGRDDSGRLWLKTRTRQSRIEIDVATRTRCYISDDRQAPETEIEAHPDHIELTMSEDIDAGETVRIEKIAAVYTSRDPAIAESGLAARDAVERASDFDTLLRSHIDSWSELWRRCDIRLEDGNGDNQLIVRLHLFHILQATSIHTRDLDVGVPARGLSGEAYHGHIFWDELFVIPYISMHFPEVSRAMLRYRYLRLPEARERARDAGYRGAMFPWQSGSTGREETPPLYANPRTGGWITDHTPLQRHIGAAIAYNCWHYYEVTGDREYLATEGAELLLEIARFWSSIATWNDGIERYEIHGVMGPDEFHTGYPWADEPGLSNNTYTNISAVRTIQAALEALDALPAWRRDELRRLLDVSDNEIERWRDITRRMRVVFLETGELAQFEHYERLEELDWDAYRERYGDLQRLDYILDAEGDTPNRYRLSKQPDVLMLFYLLTREELATILDRLGYAFDEEAYRRTTEYYMQRSSQGSTLSRVVDAEIMAGLDRARSWKSLETALQSDVGDIQGGSTGEGIHLGAMAGTIAIIERRYAGVDARGERLTFQPALPDELRRLSMSLLCRGQWLDVEVTHRHLHVRGSGDEGKPVGIAHGEREQQVTPDAPFRETW